MFEFVQWIFAIIGAVSVLTYAVPLFIQSYILKEQNLKTKYNAKWALVTGGSSGIGRAVTEKLASQGINVVIAALEDDLLHDLFAKMKREFPHLQFRAVGVNLGTDGYMQSIAKATEDIEVSLLFNNAGFVTVGLFPDVPLEKHLANVEVNSGCAVKITHHFLNKMLAKNTKGAVIFTSSSAGFMASPFASMYGSTKAFLTEFAISLAPELRGDGIDILVVHPSPVDTNFYKSETAHKSATMTFLGKLSYSPQTICQTIFASVGNYTVVRDQGYYSVLLTLVLKVIDPNFFSWLCLLGAPMSSEHRTLHNERAQKKKKN